MQRSKRIIYTWASRNPGKSNVRYSTDHWVKAIIFNKIFWNPNYKGVLFGEGDAG
jgi:hypothetical protein